MEYLFILEAVATGLFLFGIMIAVVIGRGHESPESEPGDESVPQE
jgi:hypothetical protein